MLVPHRVLSSIAGATLLLGLRWVVVYIPCLMAAHAVFGVHSRNAGPTRPCTLRPVGALTMVGWS